MKITVNAIQVIKFDARLRDTWDGVVKNSKNGTFLFFRAYMDYHAARFDERSIIIVLEGKAVAVFPCNRIGDIIQSHGGLTYGGLIYGHDLHALQVLEILSKISEYYKHEGASEIHLKPVPHIFHKYPAEEDLYALHRLGARLHRRSISSAIRMDCRIKFSDSRKCTIKKSVKKNIKIQESSFIDEFHDLLSQAVAKHGARPVHSAAELKLLTGVLPEYIRLFGAFSEELKLLAGAVIYDFGIVAHTQYMASSDDGRKVGALDFLLAQLIENTFSNCQYFSFGISTEQEGLYLNEGLIFQKEGFGARGVVQDVYQWVL